MIEDLKGKVVLVTGASTGIGAAAAKAFAANGARVAVHYNTSEAKAREVAAEIESLGSEAALFCCDLTDSAAVRKLVDEAAAHFGWLDILVNNAGGLVKRVPLSEVDDAFFDAVLDLNVRSLVTACSAAVPHFRRQGGGNIINVTSVAARNGGGPGASLYAGAKGFVSTFTRSLSKELVKERIRVNAIAPGVIFTPFHERFSSAQQLEAFKAAIPMGRLGTPDECGGAFIYLASDALSSYVTGQVLEVNGGQWFA